jgi:tetratricopeptide (TPR) repeat protein
MKSVWKRWRRYLDSDLACILLLLILSLFAYENTFSASFHFDDIPQILQNDTIRDLHNIKILFFSCKERFITNLTFALNYHISGLDPISYHITNFYIHYLTCIFLYFFVLEVYNTPALQAEGLSASPRLLGFLAAAVFLLHPLQTESVTYIVQRAESMAGMFYLATLLFYVKARLAGTRKYRLGYGLLALVAALGAAFSKETTVTLPAMLLLCEKFFFSTSLKDLLKSQLFLAFFLPAGIIVFYKLASLVQRGFLYDPGIPFTRGQYLLTQLSVLSTYLRLYFWPTGQNVDWDYPIATDFFSPHTLASSLVLLVLLLLSVRSYRSFRLFSLGILAFFVTLAPTSSIIPIKDVIFEHRMYLAVAFLSAGCVHLVLGAVRKSPRWLASLAVAGVVSLLPVLCVVTHARNGVWQTELSLWEDAVRKSPNKARPHNNYGRALYLFGNRMSEEAKRELEIAKRIAPDHPITWHALAVISFQEGDYARAIACDLEATKRAPDYGDALHLLGRSYKQIEQWDKAQLCLGRLLRLPPSSSFLPAYLDLVEVYLAMGLQGQARDLAERMGRLPETWPSVSYYKGMAFYRLSDFSRAKFYFATAVERGQSVVLACLMLGYFHYLEAEYEEAEQVFRRALEEQPWSPMLNYNIALVLEQRGKFGEAVKNLEHTIAADPFSLGPYCHLIKLYGHLGLKAEQIETTRKLLGLKPRSAEYAFLRANAMENLKEGLSKFAAGVSAGEYGLRSERTLAAIAALTDNYREAVGRYGNYLESVTDKDERARVLAEVRRLEGLLQGKEPLWLPASVLLA